MNKLCMVQGTGRLICNWVATGDPKMPLACVWARPPEDEVAREGTCRVMVDRILAGVL